MAKRVYRSDVGQLGKAVRLPNGFVRADARLTREGVFQYDTPNGPRFEYRPASEVFNPSSVETFAQAPITDGHPPKLLDADNADKFTRGSTGENLRRDGDYLTSKLLLTNRGLIAKMDAGIREVSCGYTCELEETPGVFEGQRYDCIQRNIVGNHVAIVEKGRAGEGAHVRMDKKGSAMKRKVIVVRKDELSGTAVLKDEEKGFEVEMPLEWASHIQQAYAGNAKPQVQHAKDADEPPTNENSNDRPDEEVPGPMADEGDDVPGPKMEDEDEENTDEDMSDESEKENTGPLTAEADEEEEGKPPMQKKAKDRKDAAGKGAVVKPSIAPVSRKEFDRLMARLDAQDEAHKQESNSFGKRVAARASLDRRATAVLGERFDSANMSDRKVHLSVLAKLTPKTDYSKRSDDYVEARFDAEVASHAKGAAAQRSDYQSLSAGVRNDADDIEAKSPCCHD
jgi:hypothetical protein